MIRIATIAVLIATLFAGLLGTAVSASSPEMVKVIIGFDREPGPAEEAIILNAGGKIKHKYRLVRALAARVPATALPGLLQNPGVISLEEDSQVFTVDIELDNSWGVNHIAAGVVHDAGNKGAGVKVAIIDSGIDYTHPDLSANYAGGYDFVNDDADPMDDNGHGTHVAGTIAGRDDGVGVVGVAPEARLYALKILNANGSGYSSDVIAAIEWCIANGIQVTNNSYGQSTNPGPVYQAVFDKAYAAGILHVAAAGNSGNTGGTGDTVGYPAKFYSVVAVAATDKNNVRASWSSTGPDVELSAPGVGITSTLPGGGYGLSSGTSMAAPHVTGLAALVFTSGITDSNGNGRVNDEVREKLATTADDIGAVGRDTLYGYGIVDAREAASVPEPIITPGNIQGTVTDGANPVAGATVTDGTNVVVTDTLGEYMITGVSPGTYTVTASAVGYQSNSLSVTVQSGQTVIANFDLSPVPPAATTVGVNSITYVREGGKRFRMTAGLADNLGKTVTGASVSIDIYRNGSHFRSVSGTTGADGKVTFRITNVLSGTYTSKVTGVVAAGLTWDGITPSNSYT
ncbi:MAG: S8 family serine peptidase, partial [Chloroflexi bacterium]|nr:S8 family serine peptidase [Chloroflexota bacterium]